MSETREQLAQQIEQKQNELNDLIRKGRQMNIYSIVREKLVTNEKGESLYYEVSVTPYLR